MTAKQPTVGQWTEWYGIYSKLLCRPVVVEFHDEEPPPGARLVGEVPKPYTVFYSKSDADKTLDRLIEDGVNMPEDLYVARV